MTQKMIDIANYVRVQLGLKCEIIGDWLWVTEYTNVAAKRLKKIGFKYSQTKDAFYFVENRTPKKTKYVYSIDQLRQFYNKSGIVTK